MKKNNVWIMIIVLLIIALAVGLYFYKKTDKTPIPITNNSEPVITSVNYYCDQGNLKAEYKIIEDATSTVSLTLKDGSLLVLNQTVSGSGIRYENNSSVFISKGDSAMLTQNNVDAYTNCISGETTHGTDATLNIFKDTSHTFSFSYPGQFVLSGGGIGYATDWAQQTTSTGLLLAKVIITKDFIPKTNFSEGKFTVGTSEDPDAIINCLKSNLGSQIASNKVMIGNREFTKISFADAGAGNYYETTTYRTIYNNQCYAIEYTIHSTNIGNYSLDQGITEFDKTKIVSILDAIVNSFKFL